MQNRALDAEAEVHNGEAKPLEGKEGVMKLRLTLPS